MSLGGFDSNRPVMDARADFEEATREAVRKKEPLPPKPIPPKNVLIDRWGRLKGEVD